MGRRSVWAGLGDAHLGVGGVLEGERQAPGVPCGDRLGATGRNRDAADGAALGEVLHSGFSGDVWGWGCQQAVAVRFRICVERWRTSPSGNSCL